ncbi:cadherin-like domain-containing protein [Paenibacillus oenotherae]|uniref:Cadherin-like domain-containing protein n=1 Tax=Paenibacillus oenotherae TaxID=1435645 RepID=A0ABS7D477_9BACL|nr:Ig-like domain-containing protein [Paenibacillus oenotherae]MBW7474690.1 cadherin-like domain-containing protein [Paenibacillus oenotherae]
MKTEKKHKGSISRFAKLMIASAGIAALAVGIPAIAAASLPPGGGGGTILIENERVQDYLDDHFSGTLRAGDNLTIDLNAIFDEPGALEYSVVVQNASVADVKVADDTTNLRIGLKKQGTTMVTLSAKKQGQHFVEKFRLTASANSSLDANGDGAGIDEVVKYFKAHPEKFSRIEDYRNLLQAAVSSTVTMPNHAPAKRDGALSELYLFQGGQTRLDMNELFQDEDGDQLTFTVEAQPLNNGIVELLMESNGMLQVKALNYSQQPVNAIVTASDGTAATARTFQITVLKSNHPPVAHAGTLSLAEDTAATGTLSGTDVDGDAITYSLESQANKGTVTITNSSTGAYTYVPNPNANGPDTFTFKVSDGTAYSAAAQVSVHIEPVEDHIVVHPQYKVGINNDGAVTLRLNQKIEIDMERIFSNPDNKSVEYGYTYDDRLDVSMEGNYLTIAGRHEVSESPFIVNLKIKENVENSEWFSYPIRVVVTEEDDLANMRITPDPESPVDLDLAEYFDLGGLNDWTLSVASKDADNGSLSSSLAGTSLTLRGLADGASKLSVNVDDGHGGVIMDEIIVYVGEWLPHDIGTQYLNDDYEVGIFADIDLSEIFYGAVEYQVTGIEDVNHVTTDRPLHDWFGSAYGSMLRVMSTAADPASVTVRARNEFGQESEYELHFIMNYSPQYVGGVEPIIVIKGQTYLLNMNDPVRFEDADGHEMTFSAEVDDANNVTVKPANGSIIPLIGEEVGETMIHLNADDGHSTPYSLHYFGVPLAVLESMGDYVRFADAHGESQELTSTVDIASHLNGLTGPYTVSVSESSIIDSYDIDGSMLSLTAKSVHGNRIYGNAMLTVTVSDGTTYRDFNIFVYIPRQIYH